MYTPEVIVVMMIVIVMVMIVIVMVIVSWVHIPPICRMMIVVMGGCRRMEPTAQSQSRRNRSQSRRWFVRVRQYCCCCCGIQWTSAQPIVGHQERTSRVTGPVLPVTAQCADDGLRPI